MSNAAGNQPPSPPPFPQRKAASLLRVKCPYCAASVEIAPPEAGGPVRCQDCDGAFQVALPVARVELKPEDASSRPHRGILICTAISALFSLASVGLWITIAPIVAVLPLAAFALEIYYLANFRGWNRSQAHNFAFRMANVELATGVITFLSPPSLLCGFLNHSFSRSRG